MAAGAATVYRNYFAPVGGQIGQTSDRQIDGLAAVGEGLAAVLGIPAAELWSMHNGYARCSRTGLKAISGWIETALPTQVDEIRSRLRIGLHWDVDVMHAGVRCIRWCRRHSAPQFPWLIMGKQP
jgi:hypothetical protein